MERKLKKLGYVLSHHGGNHDLWAKDGRRSTYQGTMKLGILKIVEKRV